MRKIRTLIVLAAAGYALVKAWPRLKAMVPGVKAKVGEVQERVQPMLREASESIPQYTSHSEPSTHVG